MNLFCLQTLLLLIGLNFLFDCRHSPIDHYYFPFLLHFRSGRIQKYPRGKDFVSNQQRNAYIIEANLETLIR